MLLERAAPHTCCPDARISVTFWRLIELMHSPLSSLPTSMPLILIDCPLMTMYLVEVRVRAVEVSPWPLEGLTDFRQRIKSMS